LYLSRITGILPPVRWIETEAIAAWRAFPLAQAETVANLPAFRDQILAFLLNDPPERHGEPIEEWALGHSRKPRLPRRPARGRYPDSFYERLAALYRYHVARGDHPAQRIAADEEVPVSTVHRWIREARRRGTPGPAGAKGRAG
jgi:hypothetical protein